MHLGDAIADLMFGAECVGCRRSGWGLCDRCRARLTGQDRRESHRSGADVTAAKTDDQPGLPWRMLNEVVVVSACDYEPPVPAVIKSWKDHGAWGLTGALVDALQVATSQLRVSATAGYGARLEVDLVVPVPSTTQAVRERGFDHAAALAAGLARRHGWSWRRLLRRTRGGRDQAELGREQRWLNQRGRLVTTDGAPPSRILLVDDLVTTGATLTAASQALSAAGHHIVAAATVANAQLISGSVDNGAHPSATGLNFPVANC